MKLLIGTEKVFRRSGRFFSLAVILWIIMSITLTACFPKRGRAEPYSASFFAMDTYMTFTVYDDDAKAAKEALQQAQEEIEALEALWSVTDEDSDIYALNHSGGQPVTVRDETAGLLSFAVKMAQETDGALEPTLYPVLTAWGFTTEGNRIPAAEEIERLLECVGYDRVKVEGSHVTLEDGMMLDLGSVGKGYAGDRAEQILIERGINSALLDIGGNIQAVGARPDGSDWRAGRSQMAVTGNWDCAVLSGKEYSGHCRSPIKRSSLLGITSVILLVRTVSAMVISLIRRRDIP